MYKLTNTSAFIRTTDGACIPADPGNNDYANCLKWIAAGNTPLPVDVPAWTPAKEAELSAMRGTFEKTINRLMGIAARLGRAGDAPGALSCDRAVEALVALSGAAPVVAAGTLPALKLAVKNEYAAAEALLSASALAAFRGMGR